MQRRHGFPLLARPSSSTLRRLLIIQLPYWIAVYRSWMLESLDINAANQKRIYDSSNNREHCEAQYLSSLIKDYLAAPITAAIRSCQCSDTLLIVDFSFSTSSKTCRHDCVTVSLLARVFDVLQLSGITTWLPLSHILGHHTHTHRAVQA